MFEGKVWWITGASSGIGAALAQALSDAGAKLILSGRNVSALEEVKGKLKTEALVLPFEVTDFAALPDIVETAWNWAGGISGLVNNAGISQRSMAVDTVFEVYQKIIDIDLLAPIALAQAILPKMVAAGGGHLVGISSVAGIAGPPLRSAYSAAKAGIIGYHDSVRAETAHQGIKVLVVAPGSVNTNVSRNALDGGAKARGFSDSAIDNGLPAEEAARQIVGALYGGVRELVLAEGMEAEIARLRRADPDKLFDLMAQMVAGGYAQKLGVEEKS